MRASLHALRIFPRRLVKRRRCPAIRRRAEIFYSSLTLHRERGALSLDREILRGELSRVTLNNLSVEDARDDSPVADEKKLLQMSDRELLINS